MNDPGVITTLTGQPKHAVQAVASELSAVRFVLAERERELLEIQGPCSNRHCRLHYAHSGPCDT